MTRHTTFRYSLDPTGDQRSVLLRHAGASRFAFNQCLRMVKTALSARNNVPDNFVPWSGFDLINAFNAWKKTDAAGRTFAVDTGGAVDILAIGLAWRNEVCQQVFEEAAVDCGQALAAWSRSRSGKRPGRRVGFPRFKQKNTIPSFRLRNRNHNRARPAIRVGDGFARSVTLPGVGAVRVHDNTRPVRRLLANDRARILFATVSYRAGRWWCSLNVEAAKLHSAHRHLARPLSDHGGWVGVDRGLSAFLVAASIDGRLLARVDDPPKALARGVQRQRQLARSLSRKQNGSRNRSRAAAKLFRHHHRVRNIRRHFLHHVSGELVKTHDRLVLEDLNIAGMMANRRLARAISDAGWSEFAKLLRYKQAWRGGVVETADRWYPSSQICSRCQARNRVLTLADRVFTCPEGHTLDRDLNAAVNLAAWGEQRHRCSEDAQSQAREPEARAPVTKARRRKGSGRHPARVDETGPGETGTDGQAAISA
jgi:putative transposase